ncbi:hypothetical protein JTE90_004585 [Oedothorax gibbosus]|uniref:Uncharacterized protein n=1 Tax=Oedothorax gibbosus TaxID=931172 RepID=A0AAV6ULH9_9ARAC|nr:hypothetical protein JTE90_004585 [Oedothorax gibbosus]
MTRNCIESSIPASNMRKFFFRQVAQVAHNRHKWYTSALSVLTSASASSASTLEKRKERSSTATRFEADLKSS